MKVDFLGTKGDPTGTQYVRVNGKQYPSDALPPAISAKIAQACNCHDDLVTELKKGRALAWRESLARANGELGEPYLKELVKSMDAILAKAEALTTPNPPAILQP